MKVVLLAGGFGTRISEESQYKPKPMLEIGNMPILWHIMKCLLNKACFCPSSTKQRPGIPFLWISPIKRLCDILQLEKA